MVTHAVKRHLIGVLPQRFDLRKALYAAIGTPAVYVIAEGDAVGIHTGAICAFPVKIMCGQRLFLGRGAHKHVVFHAALPQDHRQASVMTKGVHVITGHRHSPEFFLKIPLGDQGVTGKGLAARDIAIRLYEPSPRKTPTSLPHSLADLLKHIGIAFFDPHIIGTASGGEFEIIKLLHAIQCATEGCFYFGKSFLPLP